MEEAVKTVEADGKKKVEEAKKTANLKTSRSATAGKAPDPPAAPKAELFAGSMPPAAAPAPAAPATGAKAAEPQPIRRRSEARARAGARIGTGVRVRRRIGARSGPRTATRSGRRRGGGRGPGRIPFLGVGLGDWKHGT